MTLKTRLFASALLLAPAVASAHPGHDGHEVTWDFASGLQHPLDSLPHLLLAVAVGLVAARLAGPRAWIVPGVSAAALAAGAAGAGAAAWILPGCLLASLALLAGAATCARRGRHSPVLALALGAVIALGEGLTHGAGPRPAASPFVAGLAATELGLQFAAIIVAQAWAARRDRPAPLPVTA